MFRLSVLPEANDGARAGKDATLDGQAPPSLLKSSEETPRPKRPPARCARASSARTTGARAREDVPSVNLVSRVAWAALCAALTALAATPAAAHSAVARVAASRRNVRQESGSWKGPDEGE